MGDIRVSSALSSNPSTASLLASLRGVEIAKKKRTRTAARLCGIVLLALEVEKELYIL